MSAFKKTCFSCGKKFDTLLEGNICEGCFKEHNPPVKEVKPVNLKVCNQCGKIHVNNALQTIEDVEKMLPKMMKERVVVNVGYKLNDVEIKNFELEGNKIIFDLGIDCSLKE